jgi:hypothetical protein
MAAAPAGRIVLVIAEVLANLRVQRGFQDVLGQLIQQSVRAYELNALLLGLGQPMFCKQVFIHRSPHGLECF